MSEEQKQEEEVQEEATDLKSILKQFAGSPSPEQIETWKGQFGDVYVSGFSPEELFIWRGVNRKEWVKLQTVVSENPEMNNFEFEQLVCDNCILWKSIDVGWDEGKAGTPSSLHEQILQNSNFLTPQAAGMLVAKL